jgi:hypothetical protein
MRRPGSPWTFDQADFLVAYLCAMHGLMILNLMRAGSFIGTPVLLPLELVPIALGIRFFARQLGGPTPRLTVLDLVFSGYLLLAIVSLVDYAWPSNPASIASYLYGLNVQVLPMFTYFLAKGFDEQDLQRVIRVFIMLQVACSVIGIPLFFGRPDFYTAYLVERLGFTTDYQNYARLQSYMGSTAVGILSAVAIALLTKSGFRRVTRYMLALLFMISIFLTQQRGAYVSGALATAYLLYKSRVSLLQLSVAVVIIGVVVVLVASSFGLTFDLAVTIAHNRVVDDIVHGDPLGERAVSWAKGFRFVSEFPLGLGLGATTSAADTAGAHAGGQVVDAYYMRVASDLGIAGLIWFLLLLATAGLVSLFRPATEAIAVVVAIFAFQSIGTNVLDSFYVSHVFWMLLGYAGQRIDRVALPRHGFRLDRKWHPSLPAAGKT